MSDMPERDYVLVRLPRHRSRIRARLHLSVYDPDRQRYLGVRTWRFEAKGKAEFEGIMDGIGEVANGKCELGPILNLKD